MVRRLMRLGSGPRGVRFINGKMIDDDGNEVIIARGGITNVAVSREVYVAPAAQPQPTQGLIWTANYDNAMEANAVSSVWAHVQRPNNPGLSGPIRTGSMLIVDNIDVPGSGMYRPTGKCMRVELLPYDNGNGDVNASNDTSRAEVYDRYPNNASSVTPGNWPDPVDTTRWYGFSVFIPSDFTTSTSLWFDLLQWKGFRGGSPPQALEIDGSNFELGGTKARRTLGPINKGQWTRFEIGFHWSPVGTSGWVNVFRNGSEVVAQETRATMDYYNSAPDPVYLKQGIYRSKGWTATHILHFGPTKIGYSHADVIM